MYGLWSSAARRKCHVGIDFACVKIENKPRDIVELLKKNIGVYSLFYGFLSVNARVTLTVTKVCIEQNQHGGKL